MLKAVPIDKVSNLHKSGECLGIVCPLHNPSSHPYHGYPLLFNGSNILRQVPIEILETGHSRSCGILVDPDDYILRTHGNVILLNSVECLNCHDEVTSKSVHDFAMCSCGKTYTDGGIQYIRRTLEHTIDHSITFFIEESEYGFYSGQERIKLLEIQDPE